MDSTLDRLRIPKPQVPRTPRGTADYSGNRGTGAELLAPELGTSLGDGITPAGPRPCVHNKPCSGVAALLPWSLPYWWVGAAVGAVRSRHSPRRGHPIRAR